MIAGFGVFVVSGAAFLAIEARRTSPMLPLSFFRNHTFSTASLVGLLINFAFYGLIFAFSLYFQQIKRFTPLTTGLAFMPMTVIVVASNIAAGQVSAWLGARPPMAGGQAIFAAGCLLLAAITATTAYNGMWWQMVMIGAGIGLTVPPMTSALLATVDQKRSGVASGVLNTTRQAGSVIGVAFFGALIADRHQFVAGLHLALYISAAVLLIGTVAASIGIRDDRLRSADDVLSD